MSYNFTVNINYDLAKQIYRKQIERDPCAIRRLFKRDSIEKRLKLIAAEAGLASFHLAPSINFSVKDGKFVSFTYTKYKVSLLDNNQVIKYICANPLFYHHGYLMLLKCANKIIENLYTDV